LVVTTETRAQIEATTATNARWAGANQKNRAAAIRIEPIATPDAAATPTWIMTGSGAIGSIRITRPPASTAAPPRNGRLRRQ
jgi:hypothetical protein